ncbi:MAG: chemotaxis protein CheD [Planctomycetes bacterium]|nr:chemotaxis protein CheD [Planctomycetota bacterium]
MRAAGRSGWCRWNGWLIPCLRRSTLPEDRVNERSFSVLRQPAVGGPSIITLGVGELAATTVPGSYIRTFALGSCVSVIILDPSSHCVAMDHVALPDSSVSPEKARGLPGHFADTGIPALLEAMRRAGASSNYRDHYFAKMVGGANVMDPHNAFNIGGRNALAIKSILRRLGISVIAEDLGGRISRTVGIDVATGTVRISSPGRTDWEV